MHLPVAALPGAPSLLQDPAAQAVAAQVFGRRAAWWNPGQAFVVAQLGYTPANKAGDTFSGDVVLGTPGLGLKIKEGSNARMGVATLVAGTVTVNTTAVTNSSRIMLSGQNASGTHGHLNVSARTAGTSFSITSSDAGDTRTVAWIIFEPAP
jgi:hypothetical protein